MKEHLVVGLLLVALGGGSAAGEEIRLSDCVVSLKEQVLIPARAAGVLVSLPVREGSQVHPGQSIGQIDNSQQQLEHNLALVQQMETAEIAASDIEIRYAQAADDVANAELHAARQINYRVDGTVPASEVRQLELSANRAKLLVERSESEKRIAALTLKGRELAVSIAQQKVARCEITSPIAGQVIEVQKNVGEWVQPGETIAHVVRLDTLRVEGFVPAADHSAADIVDQFVTIVVPLAKGHTAKFSGRIVFVRPVIQGGGQFLVHAEVVNREMDNQWLLRPGMIAEMVVGKGS